MDELERSLAAFVDTLDLAFKRFHERSEDGLGVSKLTINQLRYIEAVHRLGTATLTEVAEHLKLTKASVTAGVKKLVAKGYITKTQSTGDRRVFYVGLSAAGEQLVQAKQQALEDYGAFVRAALSPEEARELERVTAKLVAHFKQA